ncbi:protein kinase [Gemmatimonadota bacterium]
MIGKTIDRYTIINRLGEGGMGEVYLAHDTSLDRKVALKFLPEHLQQDSTSRERFLREARSAAALDHPFICKIYEVGEEGDTSFIAMEYVPGNTLQEMLLDGPLPLLEGIRTAAEIAEALEKAHQEGIIHRDLKPANIMLTADGHVKVMDFGLAKRVMDADLVPSEVPAARIEGESEADRGEAGKAFTDGLTQDGAIVGTLPYMSPEQIRGEPLDTRSDLFSFGIMLYEMLTGVHPYSRETQETTASAILTDEATPPIETILSRVPVELHHILETILAKEPEERYHPTTELRGDLTALIENLITRRRRQVWIPIAALMVLVVTAGIVIRETTKSPIIGSSFTVRSLAPMTEGRDDAPDWHPQGTAIAFVSDAHQIGNTIWTCAPDGSNPTALDELPYMFLWNTIRNPKWSPDGDRIAFVGVKLDARLRREQGIWEPEPGIFTITPQGDDYRKLVSFERSVTPRDLAWSPNGDFILYGDLDRGEGGGFILVRMELDGGKTDTLYSNWYSDVFTFDISPSSTLIAMGCEVNTGTPGGPIIDSVQQIHLLNLESGRVDTLALSGFRPRWYPNGRHVIFLDVIDETTYLCSVRVNRRTGRRKGRVERQPVNEVLIDFAISPDGRSIVGTAEAWNGDIWIARWQDTDPIQFEGTEQLTPSESDDSYPRWLQGGEEFLYMSDRGGSRSLWNRNLRNRLPTKVTPDLDEIQSYLISPDNRWIVYSKGLSSYTADKAEDAGIWAVPLDGGNRNELVPNSQKFFSLTFYDWSHDGQKILAAITQYDPQIPLDQLRPGDQERSLAIIELRMVADRLRGEIRLLDNNHFLASYGGMFSPDSNWIVHRTEGDSSQTLTPRVEHVYAISSIEGDQSHLLEVPFTAAVLLEWTEEPSNMYWSTNRAIWRVPVDNYGNQTEIMERLFPVSGQNWTGSRIEVYENRALYRLRELTRNLIIIEFSKN